MQASQLSPYSRFSDSIFDSQFAAGIAASTDTSSTASPTAGPASVIEIERNADEVDAQRRTLSQSQSQSQSAQSKTEEHVYGDSCSGSNNSDS